MAEKKNPDFLASKQYNIKLHNLNKFDQVLSRIDPKGVQSTNIINYDYSKMSEIKREMKIQALLAAKDKATYLLNSLGEKLGRPIDITEQDNSNYPVANEFANRMMNKSVPNEESDINFKTIKLSFQVQVIFEIVP